MWLINPFDRFFYIAAYLLMLYVRPHEFMEKTSKLPVQLYLLVFATFLWSFRQEKNFEAPQFRLLPVLLVAAALSVAANGWLGGAVGEFVQFGPTIMLFFVVATSVDSLQKLRRVYFVLAAAMVAITAHGYVQWSEGQAWSPAVLIQGRITYLGFLNDPNDLAMFILMCLPIVMYLASSSGFIMRLTYWALAAAMAFNVYLTNSRGAILALATQVTMASVWRFGFWKGILVIPVMMAPVLALAPSRAAQIDASEMSALERVYAWYEGIYMIFHNPIFGVGKDLFTEHHYLTAHNSFVLAAAELGIPGYFIWLSVLVMSWIMMRRIEKLKPVKDDTSEKALQWKELHKASRALFVGFVAAWVCAFFLSRSYAINLYMHMALIVAVYQMARKLRPQDVLPVDFKEYRWPMVKITFLSLFGLWVVVRILLMTAR